MTIPPDYVRVSARRPCPICSRPDWCLLHRDGDRACCARTPSGSPFGEAGWVHKIDAVHAEPIIAPATKRTLGFDVVGLAMRYESELPPAAAAAHAEDLGTTAESLKLLRCGWSKGDKAFAWPMRSGSGDIVGIRLRSADGGKWAVRGSKEGLFYSPLRLSGETLWIVEGPTDTAVMLDMGLCAIGRPSCTGGVEHLLSIIKPRHHVVIVADNDSPKFMPDGSKFYPGQDGADALAARVAGKAKSVKIILPLNGKDVREWKSEFDVNADRLRRLAANALTISPTSLGRSSPQKST